MLKQQEQQQQQQHKHKQQQQEIDQDEVVIYKCTLCEATFKFKLALKGHYEKTQQPETT